MKGDGSGTPSSAGSRDHIAVIKMESPGSESPRSARDVHRGSGNLRGGGLQKVYVSSKPELEHAMHDSYPRDNLSINADSNGKRWMTAEELEYDAELLRQTNSTIWMLFWWNVILAAILLPILALVHCDVVEGNLPKLIYRGILVGCLIFCIAQLLYLIHPLLWGAARFPGMVDRLFLEAYPRDEYHINHLKERFACEFETHEILVHFDLQQPCIPKMKNSLFPTYTVLLLIFIDILPFLYAIFIYAWDAWIKNSKMFRNARKRVELNNSRRVPFPKHNNYEPPERHTPKLVQV
ncbi:hypothetical protein GCK32_014717 [Trichostrongylus colubriformis]|uniref:Uncharacterized protein n=1 Tax=Trichostrongylus colubriformis TaxID=6319 RepID=A0AAN8EX01_TRICO